MTETTLHTTPVNEENLGDLQGEFKARWVALSTEFFDHEAFAGEPFSRRDAWLWLIVNAAWKSKRVRHKGNMLTLERGQVLVGRTFLAETWGWSEQSVRTFIKFLISESMLKINQSIGHFANVATICNYEKYQTPNPDRGQSNNQSLTRSQPEPNQTLTKYTNNTNKTRANDFESEERERKRQAALAYEKQLEFEEAKQGTIQ